MFAGLVTCAAVVLASGWAFPVSAAGPQGTTSAAATKPDNVLTGTIDAVTVYRGQAQVARLIEVPGGAGLREVVVTNLPEAIVPGSLYAESAEGGGVEIRSVSYRVRPIGEDSRESVRAAEKAVRDARDALDAAKSQEDYQKWQRAYLDKLENFVAPSAQAELKSGVLNAETLSKLTELVTTKRKSQTEEWQKLSLEVRTLTEALQLRERELAVLTASTSRTAREAVVFVNATKAGASLRLSYLVNGANWSPSYNLRIADAKAEKATLEYQGSVQQMSGEDWVNVKLTLSTATPALVATGPALQPLSVALAQPSGKEVALALLKDKGYDVAKRELAAQMREVEKNRNVNGNDLAYAFNAQMDGRRAGGGGEMGRTGAPMGEATLAAGANAPGAVAETPVHADRESFATVLSLDSGLNEVADKSQLLDLISTTKVERKTKQDHVEVRQGDEGVSVTYKVAGRTSMPSRADQQLIQIAQMELPAQVVRSATPTLTQFVYNEAHVTNAGETVLLAGPAASYIGGEFVGSGGVPTVAAGESFRAGFGIDSSLRTSKELVERSDSTQGGNRIIEFTYKLTIENFGKAPAAVRLLDRLPSPKGLDIKLTPVEPKPGLSEDKEYRDTDYKKNILRWDVTVPPGATGTKAFAVEYKFKLEYDKQMTLTEGK
jgi:hypothetical protein